MQTEIDGNHFKCLVYTLQNETFFPEEHEYMLLQKKICGYKDKIA